METKTIIEEGERMCLELGKLKNEAAIWAGKHVKWISMSSGEKDAMDKKTANKKKKKVDEKMEDNSRIAATSELLYQQMEIDVHEAPSGRSGVERMVKLANATQAQQQQRQDTLWQQLGSHMESLRDQQEQHRERYMNKI